LRVTHLSTMTVTDRPPTQNRLRALLPVTSLPVRASSLAQLDGAYQRYPPGSGMMQCTISGRKDFIPPTAAAGPTAPDSH
jgi:hypothetical protein